jgi:hypothetical protein
MRSSRNAKTACVDNRAQQAIAVRELDATAHHPLQHNQLMTKRHVLRRKSVL